MIAREGREDTIATDTSGPRVDRGRFTVNRLRRFVGENFVPARRRRTRVRRELSERYLRGEGIEIGALHIPLWTPDAARVRYVDRMSAADLRREYPELAHEDLVDPDIIDDGEALTTLADESQDFVIANHMLEHTEDPIGTLASFARVVRPGGVLYLAVPDKRFTFDRDRAITELEHHRRDHEDGAERSRREHYDAWVREIEKVPEGPALEARSRDLEEQRYSIHFHVWDPARMRELFAEAHDRYGVPLVVEESVENVDEVVNVLRRVEAGT